MKKIIGIFKKIPVCTGLVLLIIMFILTGVMPWPISWESLGHQVIDLIIFYLVVMGVFKLFILPSIEPGKKTKITWVFLGAWVLTLVIFANVLLPL